MKHIKQEKIKWFYTALIDWSSYHKYNTTLAISIGTSLEGDFWEWPKQYKYIGKDWMVTSLALCTN